MTCPGVFWKRKREKLKIVRLTFFQVSIHSNLVHLWPETLTDSLSTLE